MVNTPNQFVACAQDEFHNVLSGVAVTPTLVSGPSVTFSPASTTTAGDGLATFTMSATRTGSSVVSAEGRQGTVTVTSNSITKTWTAAGLALLRLAFTGTNAGCTTDNSATTTVGTEKPFVACAFDEFQNPVNGAGVTPAVLSGPGSVTPASATTDSSGRATFTATSTVTGQSVITATANPAAEGTITNTWQAGTPAKVSLDPAAATNPAGTTHTFTTTVRDSFGNRVLQAGLPVAWAKVSGPGDFTGQTTSTDANGQATATYRSTALGTSTVRSCFDSEGLDPPVPDGLCVEQLEPSATATKEWVPGPVDHVHLAFTPPNQNPEECAGGPTVDSGSVDNPREFVACAHDEFQNSVSGALVTPTLLVGPQVTFSPTSLLTDSSGKATFTMSATQTGNSQVTATASKDGKVASASNTITRTWQVGAPRNLDLAPPSSQAAVNVSVTVTATLTDQFGNPNDNVQVTVTAAAISGANADQPAPTSTQKSTNASGQAAFAVTSTNAGTSTLRATASGTNSPTAAASWTEGPLEHLHLAFSPPNANAHECSQGPTTDFASVDGPNLFVACSQDEFHNPVSGVLVTPTVTAPSTVSPASATTDATGRATFSVSATQTGQAVIDATGRQGAVVLSATNTLVNNWKAGAPGHMHLAFTPANAAPDDCSAGPTTGTAQINVALQFVVCAHDQFGNRVDGAIVTPSVAAGVTGTFSPATGTANSSGRATFTVSSSKVGDTTVTAQATNTAAALNTIRATWTAGPVDHAHMVFSDCEGGPTSNTSGVGTPVVVSFCLHDAGHNGISSSPGSVSFEETGAGSFVASETATDAAGIARATITSTAVGSQTVKACFDPGLGGCDTPDHVRQVTQNWTAGPADSVALTPASQSTAVSDTTAQIFTAEVKDQFGNLVSGATVTFTATPISGPNPNQPTPTSQTKTTSSNGQATYSLTSKNVGTSTVTADIGGSSVPTDTSQSIWTLGGGRVHTLTPTSTTTRTVGVPAGVTATLTDQFGNPVSGASISLAASAISGPNANQPSVSASPQTTNASGQAPFTVTSTNAGTSNLTATAAGAPNATATATWTAGPATFLDLAPSSSIKAAGQPVPLTATVTDLFGNAISGVQVSLAASPVSGPNANQPSVSASPQTTNSQGRALFTVTSTNVGTSNLTATAGSLSDTAAATWTLAGGGRIALALSHTSRTVGQPISVTATLTDQFGNAISGAGLALTASPISGPNASQPSLSASPQTTDSQGRAFFTVTSTNAGTSTLTASASGASSVTATATWTLGAPASLELALSAGTRPAGQPIQVTATLTDEFGNPVGGSSVALAASAIPGPNENQPTKSESPRTTDAGGRATFTVTSTNVGTSTLTATAEGLSDTATATWTLSSGRLFTLEPDSASRTVGVAVAFTAALTDEFGNGVPGASVALTATAIAGPNPGQPSTSPSPAATDSQGRALFTVTSTNVGTSTLTATAEGLSDTSTATWTVGPATFLTLALSATTRVVNEPVDVTATMTDLFGNPIVGRSVTLTASAIAGPNASQPAPAAQTQGTDGEGRVSFTVNSTNAGVSTLTGSGNPSAIAKVTWTAGAFSHLHLAFSPPTADNHACSAGPAARSNAVGVTVPFVACAQDGFHNPVSGVPVTPTVQSGPGTISPASASTDASGRASFNVTSTQTGASSITATAQGVAASNALLMTWSLSAPSSITLTPATATNFVRTIHTVIATIRDQFGNLMGDGISVRFDVSGTGGESPKSATVPTVGGSASFSFTSTRVGTSRIVATSGSLTASASKKWVGRPGSGYWMAASDGGIFAFGSAGFLGSLGGTALNQPIVGMAATPSGAGYWLVARDGGIFAFGDAGFFGSTGGKPLNQAIVGMAATPSGGGYWLVASDGGIFNFGDAGFFGSTGNIKLNQPIVGMAATPSGGGYWLVASDGGIFAFGDAAFFGSTGGKSLNQAIVGMAATPSGGGYWLVASDGGIFAFGDAGFFGSTGNIKLNQAIVGMAATPSGGGYWLVASDGGIFNFGDAGFFGSMGGKTLTAPIVGMAGK